MTPIFDPDFEDIDITKLDDKELIAHDTFHQALQDRKDGKSSSEW
ncbi:hypothetical protein CI610_01022 [invertebrate metagenome]|uniref:Uncharacterized protein n=1 Tax=invertebrate metagenome TaxID=1711999 RepID=A0A2H9TA49_9ZZZZ